MDPPCQRCDAGFARNVWVCRKSEIPNRNGKCEKCFHDHKGCSFQNAHINVNSESDNEASSSRSEPPRAIDSPPELPRAASLSRKRNREKMPILMDCDSDESTPWSKKPNYGEYSTLQAK